MSSRSTLPMAARSTNWSPSCSSATNRPRGMTRSPSSTGLPGEAHSGRTRSSTHCWAGLPEHQAHTSHSWSAHGPGCQRRTAPKHRGLVALDWLHRGGELSWESSAKRRRVTSWALTAQKLSDGLTLASTSVGPTEHQREEQECRCAAIDSPHVLPFGSPLRGRARGKGWRISRPLGGRPLTPLLGLVAPY